jgi:ATP-dependent DNA helicase DinG
VEVLRICQGRAFCLFTSYEMMQKMHVALKDVLPYPLLLHGTMTRNELLYQFRTTPHAVSSAPRRSGKVSTFKASN